MNAALRLEDSQRPHLEEVWCKEKTICGLFLFLKRICLSLAIKLKWPVCVCVFNCSTLQNKYVKKHYFYYIIGGFSSQICSQHADKTEQMPQQSGAPCSLSKQARSVNMGIERFMELLSPACPQRDMKRAENSRGSLSEVLQRQKMSQYMRSKL